MTEVSVMPPSVSSPAVLPHRAVVDGLGRSRDKIGPHAHVGEVLADLRDMEIPLVTPPTPQLPVLPTPRLPDAVGAFATRFAQLRGTTQPVAPTAHGDHAHAAPAAPTAVESARIGATTLGGMLRAGLTAAPAAFAQPAAFGAPAALAQPAVAGPLAALSEAQGPFAGHGGTVAPVEGRRTSGFGPRVHPISGAHRDHNGLDIAAPTGTPVRTVTDGTVVRAEDAGGYGLLVEVDHGNGTTSRYAHLSRIDVEVGDRLDVGRTIGAVGSTGASTGPHLHVEVRQHGEPVDPEGLW